MTGYPTAAAAPEVKVQLSPADQAYLDQLYVELKPEATAAARTYVLARTPANLQVDMTAKIDADFPPPEPPVTLAAPAPKQHAPAHTPAHHSSSKSG